MANIKEFTLYEGGKSFNQRQEPSYYDLVDVNWDFFHGKQWKNAGLSDELPQPVFNNINRFVTFFVAAITANKTAVAFESPVINKDDSEDNSDEVVTQAWKEFEDRVRLDFKGRQALYDGAVTGDMVAHLRMNPKAKPYDGKYEDVIGQIELDLVDGVNFYMANPNSTDVQSQKWVIISGRDLVSNLQKEAEENFEVQGDEDTEYQASRYGQIEMQSTDGTEKATYVIYYEKKEDEEGRETVYATKCTSGGYIYKDIDIGTCLYPVAFGNWELQKNTMHGMSFVTAAIPTQIFINRGFAMAMWNVMTTAFPKLVYDKNRITGFTNSVGGQIGVDLRPNETVRGVADYLQPGNMSAQVIQMIELAQQYMQDTLGANDALLGNVNPEQASGAAISVASKQAGIPLENPKANYYNWLEDIGRIWLDMVTNLYGKRKVVMPTEDGAELVEFDFESLKDMYKNVRVDVGPSTYWSELALVQTLDNLLDRGLIQFIDYLERMPDGYIPDKQSLIDDIKTATGGEGEMSMDDFVAMLTPEEQQAFSALPPEEQERIYQEAMTPVAN